MVEKTADEEEKKIKKSSRSETVWICEECGRELKELPFPANCKCGNWCEDFFRLKDTYDYEDDKALRPLLGVKYDPKVLKKRIAHLEKIYHREKKKNVLKKKTNVTTILQKISKKEKVPKIIPVKKLKILKKKSRLKKLKKVR